MAIATKVCHPLEPLAADEVARAVEILKSHGKVTPTTRFVSVSLKEPPKAAVHKGDAPPREAFAVLFDNAANTAYEAAVSLADGELLGWTARTGVQPTMTIDEQVECEQAVLASSEFKAALKKHYGTDDTSLVMVDIWSAGNYGSEEDRTRRLARPLCFLRHDPTDNGYARPIEGLRPVVDLNTMKVIRVEEYGHWPLPEVTCNYAADRVPAQRRDIKPLEITQPEGPSFEVDGNQVRWQNWNFVIGFNAREGLTLHHLRYRDDGRDRSILYRASLTEMVVPYGDPGPTQRRKNAFDVGEYGMGMCANSLELGCDCLGLIRYFDAHLCASRGEPLTIKNAVCMHEEDFGILWKHTDRRLPHARGAPFAAAGHLVGLDGRELRVRLLLVSLPGRQHPVRNQADRHPVAGRVSAGRAPKYGNLVAPQLYAPNHQHFFNVRLDFDLDGTTNTVQQVDVVADPPGENNPFENAFRARRRRLRRKSRPGAREAGDGPDLEDRQPRGAQRRRRAGRLQVPAGRQLVSARLAQRLVAKAGRLRQPSRLGHAVPRRRTLRRRRLPEPERRRRRPHPLDRARSTDRKHRRRALVHLRPHAHPAAGGLPGDADGLHRLPAQAERLLRLNPANDVPPSPKKLAVAGSCCH